jgi:hypothetical protein
VSYVSSQGFTSFGVSGATKVSVKATRGSDVLPHLDNSTLALAHGSARTYENGLPDLGQNGHGRVVTVTIEGLGTTPPAVGSTITAETLTCKCMESVADDSAGELQKWTATYSSDFAA